MTAALEGGEWSAARPGRTLPPGKTRYPLYRRLGGPVGRSGRVRKCLAPTGIRSPNRPARSESLYRLSYPGPRKQNKYIKKKIYRVRDRTRGYTACIWTLLITRTRHINFVPMSTDLHTLYGCVSSTCLTVTPNPSPLNWRVTTMRFKIKRRKLWIRPTESIYVFRMILKSWWQIGISGRTLFDRPKSTVGCRANGRRKKLFLSHILHHCLNPKTHNKRKLYKVFNVVGFAQRQRVAGSLAETEQHFTRPRASVTP